MHVKVLCIFVAADLVKHVVRRRSPAEIFFRRDSFTLPNRMGTEVDVHEFVNSIRARAQIYLHVVSPGGKNDVVARDLV